MSTDERRKRLEERVNSVVLKIPNDKLVMLKDDVWNEVIECLYEFNEHPASDFTNDPDLDALRRRLCEKICCRRHSTNIQIAAKVEPLRRGECGCVDGDEDVDETERRRQGKLAHDKKASIFKR